MGFSAGLIQPREPKGLQAWGALKIPALHPAFYRG